MVICKNAIRLGEQKNMNLPGAIVDLPTLTPQDEDDLVEFGLKQNVDIIAASFVRKASDVENIRDVLGPKGAHIKIISKIENHEGVHNLIAFSGTTSSSSMDFSSENAPLFGSLMLLFFMYSCPFCRTYIFDIF